MGGRLAESLGERVDLLVVGGGIYGACLAHEAARLGRRVGLAERADFSGGTSGQSLRILHGGLRYLQHADLSRMRRSIRARRDWMRRFGDLVTPQAFSLPTFGHGIRGREAFAVALALNDLVSRDRNEGLPPSLRLPRGRVLPRARAAELYGGFEVDGFNGAALWYDAVSLDSERILLRVLLDAREAGARVANYAEARAIRCIDGRVRRVELVDAIDGAEHELAVDRVILAAGPWSADVLRRSGLENPAATPYSLGINVVVGEMELPHGVGVPLRREGRDRDAVVDSGTNSLFFVPWRGRTLIGTRHFSIEPASATPEVLHGCVARFLAEARALLKGGAGLADPDVVAVLAGWLPEAGEVRPGRDPVLAKHGRIVDHAGAGAAGLTTVVGVKWTTADAVARSVLGSPEPARPSAPAAPPSRTRPLDRQEVGRQVREEWVRRLSDLVLRRNALWIEPELPDERLVKLARWTGEALGWDDGERKRQVRETRAALDARRGPRSTGSEEPV